MLPRVMVALVYGIGLVATQITTVGIPTTVEGWIGLVVTLVVGFWGKFSSNTTVVSPLRAGETFDTAPKVTV